MSKLRARARKVRAETGERGFAAVWMVLTLFVLLGVAAFAVDLVHAIMVQQKAQNAADAAALGGVVKLPGDPAGAIAQAKLVAKNNGYPDGVGGVVVTVTPDPSTSELHVEIKTPADTFFAKALGVDQLTVRESSTAQFDPPQDVVSKLDVVLIIDRTSSMQGVDVTNSKTAANALLGYLDPTKDRVALGLAGPSGSTLCANGGNGRATSPETAPGARWIVAPTAGPLDDTYQNADGTLNANNAVVKTIACFNTSSVGTNLADPITAATAYLQANGRPDAKHAIILETDGQPHSNSGNEPSHTCVAASAAAAAAQNAGIIVQTIGFGLDGVNNFPCEDASGPWQNVPVRTLLANMASPVDGVPAADNGCDSTENNDGDGFFCVPKAPISSDELAKVFVKAASQVASKRDPCLIG